MPDPEKPKVLTGGDLIGVELSDWQVTAVRWTEQGVDIDVDLPSSELLGSAPARVVCRWMNNVRITVDRPGAPLSWDGSIERTPTGSFRFVLEVDGVIDLDCEELELQPRG